MVQPDLFDVLMGAYDSTEVCKLIGIFLLNLLGQQFDTKNTGLYRDDGLSIFKNCSCSHIEKIKRRLQNVFNCSQIAKIRDACKMYLRTLVWT